MEKEDNENNVATWKYTNKCQICGNKFYTDFKTSRHCNKCSIKLQNGEYP